MFPCCCYSITKSCLAICDPMDSSTPGLPVYHQFPEFTQTHVHQVGDDIQPFHPLSSPSPPAPNPSQHQGLFQWVNSLHEVAKVLEFQPQPVLPMNTQDWSPLGWTDWISLLSKGLSRVFSNTTVQEHQFFGAELLQSCPTLCDPMDRSPLASSVHRILQAVMWYIAMIYEGQR